MEAPPSEDAQEYALEGLNLNMWRVPARTIGEVRAELQASGLVDIRVDDMVFVKLVRGGRPTILISPPTCVDRNQ